MTGAVDASNQGYAGEADRLAVQYESVSFEEVHRDVLAFIPPGPGTALDIGAGTGRDAAALAARGYRVVAVEPTAELRAHGRRLHPEAAISWLDDGLPELAATLAHGERFDLIFLTAVWMHLDAGERALAMERLARLSKPGGRLFMTLRHGPVPEGRRMFDVSAEETAALAAQHGLSVTHRGARTDMLGRDSVSWSILAFEVKR